MYLIITRFINHFNNLPNIILSSTWSIQWIVSKEQSYRCGTDSLTPSCICGCWYPGPVFSYKLRYIVGFWLVEIAISTNQKPTIYRNLYENTGPAWFVTKCTYKVHQDSVLTQLHCKSQSEWGGGGHNMSDCAHIIFLCILKMCIQFHDSYQIKIKSCWNYLVFAKWYNTVTKINSQPYPIRNLLTVLYCK